MKNEKLLIAIITLISIVIILAGVGILLDKLSNGRIEQRIDSIESNTKKLAENQSKLEETTRNISETTAGINEISNGIAEQNKRIAEFYQSVGNSTSDIETGLNESDNRIDRIAEILQNAKKYDNNK